MNEVDLFQSIIVTVGGGGLVTAITLGVKTGRWQATMESRMQAIEEHFKDHGRVGLLWKFFEDGTLHKLRERGWVDRNSPWSVLEIGERMTAAGGPLPEFCAKFRAMIAAGLPSGDPDLVRCIMQELGDDNIKRRAAALDLTMSEYVFWWQVSLREAERAGDGGADVLRKLGCSR